ncbi:MAG: fasciclin domain-containing protein [Chroococcidiopsidaceae cyanobacterium CP_BM_ER_R8_30]|nr:fasciclin domain-containing protein [Chroococcidiopsidaceae cyanobacterium CP_BM_ER_R8_30]
MKPSKRNFGIVLFSVIGTSSLVALSAYSQPSLGQTRTLLAGKSLVAQTSTESPSGTPSPSDTTSPTSSPSDTSSPSASPATSQNIVDVAASNSSFSTLVQAVKAAGLTSTLSSNGPYTLFAPTDTAFAALPKGTLQNLLKPANKQKLVKILTYHVVLGDITSSQLKSGSFKTLEGSPVTVKVNSTDNTVTVNKAKVTQADIPASNGVIHAINKVLIPPGVKLSK